MKFSESWLRAFVNPDWNTGRLAHELTMGGVEVESIEPAAPEFSGVVVGEVLACERHPQADRLSVCQVHTGQETVQIVCGASNVAVGIKVPCAVVGARLPKMNIGRAKLRGVESFGMLCSAVELGVADTSDGLMLLSQDAPTGADFRHYYELADNVFTLKVTPNRGDCLSILGLAREVSALSGTSLTHPEMDTAVVVSDTKLAIEVKEPEACPLYCGRVVESIDPNATTPPWMARRLEKAGLRCIHPVVDVTNYVLLEMGQPMHAFDLGRVSGHIVVRYGQTGETIRLLNDTELKLDSDMLVIADDRHPLALAGIMGGLDSAVDASTADIFLEAAFFSPSVIAGRGRRLGFSTDSSHRFERGVDFGATLRALERATVLLTSICGGNPGPIVQEVGELPAREAISLSLGKTISYLGVEFEHAELAALVRRMGFPFRDHGDFFTITPPSYRFDLEIEADMVEEVARLYGYDNIPAPAPCAALAGLPVPEEIRVAADIRKLLVGRDYQEIISFSFIQEDWESHFSGNQQPVRLLNPIAAQHTVMRSSLMGNLVDVLRQNINRKHDRVRIFEIGGCFGQEGEGYRQEIRLAALCWGPRLPEQWATRTESVDFFDIKGDVEALLSPNHAEFRATDCHPALHPGQAAEIWIDGQRVGHIGALHPALCQQYDLANAPMMLEVELGALTRRELPAYEEISRQPPVRRDIAVVVDDGIIVGDILRTLKDVAPAIVVDIDVFDLYRGQGIEAGKKSIAFRIILHDRERTLTEADSEAAVATLLKAIEEGFDAHLR